MRPHRRSARPPLRARHGRRLAAAGMTLVELLVALLVGSFVAIAVVGVLAVAESGKRQTLAGSDMGQVGAYAMTQLGRMLRSAGSGYARSASYLFGCRLHAARGGTQILPLPSGSTLPAPFASVTTGSSGVFRLAPAVIAAGQTTPSAAGGRTSDVLLVMSGQSGQGEVALPFSTDAQAAALQLGSTVGLSAGEVLLIGDQQPASTGTAPCLITQVSSSFDASSGSGAVPLAGTYYSSGIDSAVLTDYSPSATASALGNPGNGNAPQLLAIGVGDAGTLYVHDLLQAASPALQALADGVFVMQALYGVDTDGNRVVDGWQAPSGDYAISALMDGSAAANARLRTIVAIRLGLVLRANRPDESADPARPPAPETLTLFSDLGSSLTRTLTLTKAERLYRYRTLEATVPLRNLLILK